MAASMNITVGSLVWVEDPEVAWIDGEVVEVNGEEIKISCTSGKTVVSKASNVYPKDAEAPPCGVDDMTKLAYLHEPGVLQNLRSRYDINEIYAVPVILSEIAPTRIRGGLNILFQLNVTIGILFANLVNYGIPTHPPLFIFLVFSNNITSALKVMYNSLNSAPQLTGWSSNGDDPCGQSWKGVTCSGSVVTEIKLPGLGLIGSMGYQLESLKSLTNLDMSNNNLGNHIAYQFPPNLQRLNFGGNSLTGGIPYYISQMASLIYLLVMFPGLLAIVFLSNLI